ncbi:MAG: hypothetical protein AB7I33_13285 [Gemmatimonadales bacterium]
MRRVWSVLVLALCLTPLSLAAQRGAGAGMMGGGMMAQHDSLDRELAARMTRMNEARGQDRMAAVVEVLNELFRQRTAMRAMMAKMHQGEGGTMGGGMMGGGMQHGGMQHGAAAGPGGEAGQCPCKDPDPGTKPKD